MRLELVEDECLSEERIRQLSPLVLEVNEDWQDVDDDPGRWYAKEGEQLANIRQKQRTKQRKQVDEDVDSDTHTLTRLLALKQQLDKYIV